MNKDDLTTWHHEEFWPRYRKFLETPYKNQWGPGGKGESLSKMLRINPSAALRDKMISSPDRFTEHRKILHINLGREQYDTYTKEKAQGGEKIYSNRQAKTWLNNYGWDDEIPDIESGKSQRLCKCGNPVHGPMYDKCTDCLMDVMPMLRLVK